jgi:hypothetical protein
MADSELRQLRARHLDLDGLADRVPRPGGGIARRLVQVYNGGAIPTGPDKFYLTHPVELDGPETEGGAATVTADGFQTIVVDVLGHAPVAGDMLVAYTVGGRWVAQLGSKSGGGTSPCSPCNIPKTDLTLSWNNLLTGAGSTTLFYTTLPDKWNSSCLAAGADSLQYGFSCQAGAFSFGVTIYFTPGCSGSFTGCSNPSAFGFSEVSHTCSPFSVTYSVNPATCALISSAGYTDFTITP